MSIPGGHSGHLDGSFDQVVKGSVLRDFQRPKRWLLTGSQGNEREVGAPSPMGKWSRSQNERPEATWEALAWLPVA